MLPPDATLALIAGLIAALAVALIWAARPWIAEEVAGPPPVGSLCCRAELHRLADPKHLPHWRITRANDFAVRLEWNELVRHVTVSDFWREYMIL